MDRICRKCLKSDACNELPVSPNSKRTIRINMDGKRWNGMMCPKCHIVYVRNKMRTYREKLKQQKVEDKKD